jgi:tRNA nucleotidyltransferase (CCA-adding enzyme)
LTEQETPVPNLNLAAAIPASDSMPYVQHVDLTNFATTTVNLHRDGVEQFRDQVNRLRERLEEKIAADPNFALRKMLLSGSVAKGTALKTINDIDVAVYVRSSSVPENECGLLDWLADRLRETYPRSNIVVQTHCVTIKFSSGLDVDVVPVINEDGQGNYGYLITKDTGDRVLTNIPPTS